MPEPGSDRTPPPTTSRERLIVFDTSLRDGEQAPGFQMDLREKLELARALSRLRVDVIEAGFAAASEGDLASVRAIARSVEGPTIAGLARCVAADIERTHDALRDAARSRIHVFLATSPLHREHKLGLEPAEVVRRAVEGVSLAREFCDDVEFSAEDASRTEPDFLAEVCEAVIDAGAGTVNLPDTVGYTLPSEHAEMFRRIRRSVRGADRVVWSAHCHDDLGLAVANSLAAVEAGARQVECTLGGIGERAGNAALEELVMALRTRGDQMPFDTGIDATQLVPATRVLAQITGHEIPPNKAVVGRNAFAHESGIHQHGVLQDARTYEILRPEDVGATGTELVLGKHSGRHALAARLRELGHELVGDELRTAFRDFKALCDKKQRVVDADLEAIAIGSRLRAEPRWTLDVLQVTTGTQAMPCATVRLSSVDGESREEAATGDGPVDATFKAIVRALGIPGSLGEYRVNAVGDGEDAQGSVVVTYHHAGEPYRGHGISTDTVEASAFALMDALNRVPAVARAGESFPNTPAWLVG